MFEWDDAWSVCDESLDADHKRLIDLLNRLYDFALEPGKRESFLALFKEMEAYAREHFSREERLLEARSYTHLTAHRQEHRRFEERLAGIRSRMESESMADISSRALQLLGDWLIDHILGSDQAYVPLFQSSGAPQVGPPPETK